MKPSTTLRASSSRLPIRARIFGSTNRAPAICPLLFDTIGCRPTCNTEPDPPDPPVAVYIPDAGTGTRSSSSSMIASVVIPSDSARKLTSTRWRSTGCAIALMSSKLTW